MKKIIFLTLFLFASLLNAQEYFPTNHGVKNSDNSKIVITGATIYVSPQQVIKNGTLVFEKGKIIAVGKNVSIPKDSKIVDLKGKYIYPSFIDMYSDFGVKAPKNEHNHGRAPQYDSHKNGFYWNEHIKPETNSVDFFFYNSKKADELIKLGFGTVNSHYKDGIARGTSFVTTLNQDAKNNERLLSDKAAQHFSFKRSVNSKQEYPSSQMGAIALLRQMNHDADWFGKQNEEVADFSLKAFIENKELPKVFEVKNKLEIFRANKIANEFGETYIIKGAGDEYERISEIKNLNTTFIIPINFPKAYDVSDLKVQQIVNLEDLKTWNQAPNNLNVLEKNKINFALTTADLKSKADFHKNLRKAISYGLSKEKALAALTTVPAQLLNLENEIGTLKKGALANFLITDGDIFEEGTIIYENWIQGKQNVIKDITKEDVRGTYAFQIGKKKYIAEIAGTKEKPSAKIMQGSKKVKATTKMVNDWLYINFKPNKKEEVAVKVYFGNAKEPMANYVSKEETFALNFKKTKEHKNKDKKKKAKKNPELVAVSYPNMAYGFEEQPEQNDFIIRNATVWTNEKDGILENTDVYIKNGKISKVGKNLKASGAKIIDGTGKHLTTGIIDEHSHIAISNGVNESGHNSTAEVAIHSVVNSDDVNIYRNLAGGVTTAQLLHGSANPIGGQSAIIKLKWGETPDQMIVENQPKFIKFALGENVKQTNWGEKYSVRFPQTRMGVEQVYIDYFQRAKEYDFKKKNNIPVRHDIELETLAEIINSERFISCHSYVQSEITMLMRVAEQFDFKINTFTHILEGYKVADKMKEHGVGGSTFADWWAYKYEVNDAIPYNGALMHNEGVLVAFNSDDAEMSRRLNQEAAKAVKYGNVSQEDAWKFVTLNPAKLLHLDDKLGSIKAGKDADIVLWSHNPLSTYAKAEKTFIEGVLYFDIERDQELREEIQKEKKQIIQQMLDAKGKGEETQKPVQKKKTLYHCNSEEH
ncbi:amidohydrolase family protein [Aureivirga sp. CE67]|uniref:amidohydrolase family protein n=1 Tax=Aureivirga sp. CE67 TaxID=1788983 RepID=UPI0018CB351A|nr:amidohydrolase family protein [Aureivirga sp. CE67]